MSVSTQLHDSVKSFREADKITTIKLERNTFVYSEGPRRTVCTIYDAKGRFLSSMTVKTHGC